MSKSSQTREGENVETQHPYDNITVDQPTWNDSSGKSYHD